MWVAGGAEGRLGAVGPGTGALDPDFGDGGKVDLTRNLGPHVARNTYTLTSAPLVAGDVVIVGSSIRDTPGPRQIPPGHVPAHAVRPGEPPWTSHPLPNGASSGPRP